MIWSVGVSVPRRYVNDFERFSLRPFTLRSDTTRYAVRGQFKLKEPFAHYGFQSEGYFGWGVRGGPYFKGTVFQYLRAFGIFEDSLNNRLYIIDPFNMFSYGWYIEEPYPRGQAGAHIMHGALKTFAFMSNPYGRGVDTCFNHDRGNDPTYFPPPSSAFFEDANSFVYTGNPADPRITCPALIRSDWWERLRLYLRIFDTVYILKPTEYARRCYYRLIEDELPAKLTAIFTAGDYPKKPLRSVARDLFGADFPSEVKGYGFGISARVGLAVVAPSFAQRDPKDPYAPYPITSMLSPTPPFVSEVPNLVNTAVGKEMAYTPWVSLCQYPGPTYHGNWTAIDGWGAVPPIEPMSEIQFESWRQHVREEGSGGATLFQINPDGDIHYIRTGQPFLIWGGTCGDYILLEPFDTDAQTETTTKVKVLKEGWHTTSGGLRIYSIYFIQVSVVLQTTTYHLDGVNAYEPPEPKTIEETFFPYFTVERVHKLLKGARKLLLKPKCSFARPSKINFTGVLNEMINPNAREYVTADFGTVWTEGPPGYTCSNVQVWHLGGQNLYIDPLTDRVSAYFAQKEMDDPTANRRFFVNLIGPFMDKVAKDFLVPRLNSNKLEEIVARHAPSRVALTGWKGSDVSNMSPRQIPWTMTSSGNIYTLEDKAVYFGMFQLYSKIPILSSPNGLEIAKKLLSQLPPFYPQPLPEGYELRPLPSPSVLGVGESAEGGDDSRSVVIIGLGTAGSWASIHPDKYRLRENGFVVDGLGSWTPIPLAMLYRDPIEPKPDTRIYPNKLLFRGSCVEPPELQVIPNWFVWSGSILLYSQNPNDPDSALEQVRDKTHDLDRKIHLVNAAKWRLRQFPDDWDTFDRILPLLEFNHIPFVESGRSVVEWVVVNGEKRLRLASYYQPLIVTDIKAAAPMETVAFEGAFAGCTHGSSISCALATRREHYPNPTSPGSSPSEVVQTAERIDQQLGGSVRNIGGLNVIPPHNLLAPFSPFRIPEGAYPYFGDYNAASAPSHRILMPAPLFKASGADMDIFHPPHFARFSIVPHPIHNEMLWDSAGLYSDLRKTLLEITSIVPVTLPSYQPPSEGGPKKINQDPLLFYQRIGREGLGKAADFWEKCTLVVGNGQMAVYAYLKENRPVFSGFTLSGGFFRNLHQSDYGGIPFPAFHFLPWASQIVQNITNLAAGRQVFNESSGLWQRYIIKMNPYDRWIGLELRTSPVICFFGKGFSGRDMAADAVMDKGREIQLSFARNEYPPVGDKGWQFLVGRRQRRFIVAHLGVPPLPSDFFEGAEVPAGVRDYGSFWRDRFKDHTFAGDLFAWVVPPLGWLGCVGVPGVSRLGVDPILPLGRLETRFEDGDVEYAYGNKERLRNYWTEEVRLDAQWANKEYYLRLPDNDDLEIPEEEKIYPDDKAVRDIGDFEGLRLITLCESSRRQRQKIYWSFRSYFNIWRTRVKQREAILSPEEVRLKARATRRAIVHEWVSGRPRFYVRPLFPVQWWGVPVAFTWGSDLPFWRDIIPNEYGSITFSLSVAYPFPFKQLKESLKEYAAEFIGENDGEYRQFLHRTLVDMGWVSAQSRMLLKDLIESIPDNFLVGQPWYAPFAAYYITEQALLPMRKIGYFAYALVEDIIRRYSYRTLHVNLSPTVFPDWYASKRLVNALGKLNWNRLINGASRRYPVCIVAHRSPFLIGGATYSEDRDMLFYFSHLNVPDPFVQPMLPEDIWGSEVWLEMLLTPAAGKAPSYLNRTWVREHTKPLNEFVDTQYSGIFANNFVPPFSPVPFQTYPFSIPPFIMKGWGLFQVPYWLRDILSEVRDGFICDFQDLVYCDLQRENFSIEPRIDPAELAVVYGQIRFRDCAMPNQTIGLSTWGGYAYLHRIVLPPTPVIVHSSFNFGWAEYKGIRDKEAEKTFQLVEPKLTKVPYRPYNELLVRSYFYGMRLSLLSPSDLPPLPDVLSSPIRDQGGLKQAWGILLPIRFYYSHIRKRLGTDEEWLAGNDHLRQERWESPIDFYARVMAGLPAFIFATKTWRLPHEVIDIAFSDKEEVFFVVRNNKLPRYWWVNQVAGGSKYSKLLRVDYVLKFYYPIRFRRASPWHALFDPVWGEKKLLKMFSYAWAATINRPRGKSILADSKEKKGFVRPCEISMLPLPLWVIRIDAFSDHPTSFALSYNWWADWKEPFQQALKSSDDQASLVVSRLHLPFIMSSILESFLTEESSSGETRILMQTPIAAVAKIFLDDLAGGVAPFGEQIE